MMTTENITTISRPAEPDQALGEGEYFVRLQGQLVAVPKDGIARRYRAGIRSLEMRAAWYWRRLEVSAPKEVSHYGDTDRLISVFVGDDEDSQSEHRRARANLMFILHRSVGDRPSFRRAREPER